MVGICFTAAEKSCTADAIPEDRAVQAATPALISSFQFHGWEATLADKVLIIAHESGFRFSVRDVVPSGVSIGVVGSTVQVFVGQSAQVEFRVADESARSWMVRFMHYWGFHIDGVRVEQGVVVPMSV